MSGADIGWLLPPPLPPLLCAAEPGGGGGAGGEGGEGAARGGCTSAVTAAPECASPARPPSPGARFSSSSLREATRVRGPGTAPPPVASLCAPAACSVRSPASTQRARVPKVPPRAPPRPPPNRGSAACPASADLDPVRRPQPPRPGRLGWTGARGPGLSSTLGCGGGGGLGRDQRGQSKRLGSRPSRQDGVSSREGPPPLTPRPGKRCAGARRSSDSPSRAAATAPAERGRKTKPQAASRALCLRRC